MNVALVVISDGRGYLAESIPSLIEHADMSLFSSCVIVDDSGEAPGEPRGEDKIHSEHAFDLIHGLGIPTQLRIHPERRGGAAAIQTAWANLDPAAEFVFHLEEDWTFPGPVPIVEMVDIVANIAGDEYSQGLANVVLRRQPAAGEGLLGYVGADYHDAITVTRHRLLIHQQGFWLNPCVYPTTVTNLGWPDHGHEHDFTKRCLDFGYEFAVYGSREDPPRAIHIGDRRAAAWTW